MGETVSSTLPGLATDRLTVVYLPSTTQGQQQSQQQQQQQQHGRQRDGDHNYDQDFPALEQDVGESGRGDMVGMCVPHGAVSPLRGRAALATDKPATLAGLFRSLPPPPPNPLPLSLIHI